MTVCALLGKASINALIHLAIQPIQQSEWPLKPVSTTNFPAQKMLCRRQHYTLCTQAPARSNLAYSHDMPAQCCNTLCSMLSGQQAPSLTHCHQHSSCSSLKSNLVLCKKQFVDLNACHLKAAGPNKEAPTMPFSSMSCSPEQCSVEALQQSNTFVFRLPEACSAAIGDAPAATMMSMLRVKNSGATDSLHD